MFALLFICVLFPNLSLELMRHNDPVQYCASIDPQTQLDFYQLMGIWFAVEVIYHKPMDYAEYDVHSCPKIYISEEPPTPTIPPLQKHFRHGMQYGPQYGYDEYSGMHRNRENLTDTYSQHYIQRMRLKLVWDDNGIQTEYFVNYMEHDGLWRISGPHNGFALKPEYDNSTGTIQVLKAVGNHLVLNFCHRLPVQKIYTVILSRLDKLEQTEINGVHNQLTRKGLDKVFVKKTCSHSSSSKIDSNVVFAFVTILCGYMFI